MGTTVPRSVLPQELFEPFSHPGVGGAGEVLAAIWPTFAQEAVRLFLEHHRGRLEEAAPTLRTWLQARVDEMSLADCLHPSVGLMPRPAEFTKRPIALAANLAIHLSASAGRASEWNAQLEPDSPLRVGKLIARPQEVAVRTGNEGVDIRLIDGNVTEVKLEAAADPEPTGQLKSAGIYLLTPIRLFVTSGAIPGDTFFVEEADPFSSQELAKFAEDLEAGLEFIARYAPDYLDWIATAVTVVVPCRAPEEMMLSGSSNTLPGLLRITSERAPSKTAEMLVHEASHQYLHTALRLSTVDDGTDATMYYSPARDEYRPIDKILTAYHAFANVEIMYASALAKGWQPSEGDLESVQAVSSDVDILEGPLRENSALTAAGRALVDPLVAGRPR